MVTEKVFIRIINEGLKKLEKKYPNWNWYYCIEGLSYRYDMAIGAIHKKNKKLRKGKGFNIEDKNIKKKIYKIGVELME